MYILYNNMFLHVRCIVHTCTTHIYIHVCTHTYIHVLCVYVMYIVLHVHTFIHIHVYVCMYIYMYMYTYCTCTLASHVCTIIVQYHGQVAVQIFEEVKNLNEGKCSIFENIIHCSTRTPT